MYCPPENLASSSNSQQWCSHSTTSQGCNRCQYIKSTCCYQDFTCTASLDALDEKSSVQQGCVQSSTLELLRGL